MLVRLHKYLADHGVASRRACEEYIRKGLVKVNGKAVTEMGIKIDPDVDHIEMGSEFSFMKQDFVYFAFHKPAGYVCTMTGPEEPKITDLIQKIPQRVFPIGRLDKLTSGLLLLTNDGRFAYEMSHPKFEKEKEYIVKVREKISTEAIKILEGTIFIHGQKTRPAIVTLQGPHLLRIILKEGRNRQIRRLCEKAELHIEKLKRVRIGKIQLGELEPKAYRPLTQEELTVARRKVEPPVETFLS